MFFRKRRYNVEKQLSWSVFVDYRKLIKKSLLANYSCTQQTSEGLLNQYIHIYIYKLHFM